MDCLASHMDSPTLSLSECYLSLHMQRYCELMHEESDSGEEKHILESHHNLSNTQRLYNNKKQC